MIAMGSVCAQSHDQRLSVTDHCLINTCSVHDEPCDQCRISHVISACAVTSSVHDSHVISAGSVSSSVHPQSRHKCMIATSSVRAQSHDQRLSVTDHCLINTGSVH